MRRFTTRTLAALTAAAALLATSLLTTSPANATVLDTLTCTASSTTTYDPPISATPASTTRTIHQVYGPCLGTGAAGAVTGGTHDSSNTTNRSCVQLLSTATVSWTIHWSDGSQSTVTTERVANLAGAVFTNTFTGTVTSGRLAGHALVETMTAPSTQILACTAGNGTVSSLGATHTLNIL